MKRYNPYQTVPMGKRTHYHPTYQARREFEREHRYADYGEWPYRGATGDFWPAGIERYEVMWHVTTAYSAIMREGFKTRTRLEAKGRGYVGFGGSRLEKISFTADRDQAFTARDILRRFVRFMQGPRTVASLVDEVVALGAYREVARSAVYEAMRVTGMREGELSEFETLRRAADSTDIDARETWRIVPAVLAAELYRQHLHLLETYEIQPDPVFWLAEGNAERLEELDVREVEVVEAVLDTTTPGVTYGAGEEEWRVPVGGIVSFRAALPR